MTTIDKFLSDIQKTIKFDRANNGGHYDAKRACTQIAKLFANNNRNLGAIIGSTHIFLPLRIWKMNQASRISNESKHFKALPTTKKMQTIQFSQLMTGKPCVISLTMLPRTWI